MQVDSDNANSKLDRPCYVGQQLFVRRDNVDVLRPVEHGIINDFDAIEALWDYGFKQLLRIDPQTHPLLAVESSYNTDSAREQFVERAFESLGSPALFLAKDAVLSALSVGKTSALVLDIGGGHTAAVPVYDGYVLNSALQKTKVSGSSMDLAFGKIYEQGIGFPSQHAAAFKSTKILPRFTVKRKISGDSKRTFEILNFPHTSPSYYDFMKNEVLRDIKESVARVSDEPFDTDANANIPTLPYELPDGTMLQIGTPRFTVPETLFQPSPLLGISPEDDFDRYSFRGVHHLIQESISRTEHDLRRELYQNIVVTGGLSVLPGLSERLARELENLVHNSFKVRVFSAPSAAEKMYGPWIGGSILGSLGTFQQMWVSQAEYKEYGSRILQTRFP
jgi:actin-like protein 6A